MIPGKIFTSFPISWSCQCKWLSASFRVPRTFASSSGFAEKFLSCTVMPRSIEWPSPAPRLHIDDCFEIRNLHRRPCDLLLTSLQHFSARGTASPLRLLHGALCSFGPYTDLAISVFREMNINTVLTQILTSLECGLYRDFMRNWRENLLVLEFHHPPTFCWILAATPGSQNTTGCTVLSWSPFYLFLSFCWLEFHQVALIYHQPNLTLALERCHSDLFVLESEFHLL